VAVKTPYGGEEATKGGSCTQVLVKRWKSPNENVARKKKKISGDRGRSSGVAGRKGKEEDTTVSWREKNPIESPKKVLRKK